MNEWQERFANKMNLIREQSAEQFKRYSQDVLTPVFQNLAEFVAQWDMQATSPQDQSDRRTFKFALAEDSYVLVGFRLHGLETVECGYECWIPSVGRQTGGNTHIGLDEADRAWAESCFQACLDHLANKYAENGSTEESVASVMA
jgi:hypothetical protein